MQGGDSCRLIAMNLYRFVDKPFTKDAKFLMEDFYKATLSAIPAGRMGAAQDVANAVVFLGSPSAGYISGTNVVVDGGFT